MATLLDLVRLGRPHYLVGGVLFVALGIALAWRVAAPINPWTAALVQILVTSTQWGVHYGNEWHDLRTDAANASRTRLSGGSGILVAGRATVADAKFVSRAMFSWGSLAALLLAWREPVTAMVSLPLLVLAWGYSAPPLRLCTRGLGELATGLIVAVLVPALILVPAHVAPAAYWPLVPLALQVTALVLVVSLPDGTADAATDKRTLAVRLGSRRARRFAQAAWLSCGLATTAAILFGAPPTFALAGGAAFAASVALPVLVLQQKWEFLGLVSASLIGLQLALTVQWAVF